MAREYYRLMEPDNLEGFWGAVGRFFKGAAPTIATAVGGPVAGAATRAAIRGGEAIRYGRRSTSATPETSDERAARIAAETSRASRGAAAAGQALSAFYSFNYGPGAMPTTTSYAQRGAPAAGVPAPMPTRAQLGAGMPGWVFPVAIVGGALLLAGGRRRRRR